ncbi:hypothetical protein DYB28_009058 [Aphanomyces astaci]|uniref:Myb/SANT-like domain-containing protein n=1 Tax=Aphanomyces astaci TaxID=112090 RepID=A0A9X8H8F5_APHAT|nr:hypothetical protein DYB28_009058 [Aphanomyces astaci]
MGIWTDELDKTWLEELVYQAVVMGKKSHSGFKREAWSEVLKKLNNTHNLERTMAQLKSRYDTIKGIVDINYNDDNAMDNNDQPDDASSNDEESLNNVDAGRARQSAQTEERPPQKRQRSSLASKLSADFRAVNETAVKELELLTDVLRPSSVGSGLSPTEKAVKVLQQDFVDVIDEDDMLFAFDLMENSTRAAMFLCMEGQIRSAWLIRHINQIKVSIVA